MFRECLEGCCKGNRLFEYTRILGQRLPGVARSKIKPLDVADGYRLDVANKHQEVLLQGTDLVFPAMSRSQL